MCVVVHVDTYARCGLSVVPGLCLLHNEGQIPEEPVAAPTHPRPASSLRLSPGLGAAASPSRRAAVGGGRNIAVASPWQRPRFLTSITEGAGAVDPRRQK